MSEGILCALKDKAIQCLCHIGLNPQHDQERMKQGKIVKGKKYAEAIELLKGAKILENAGADLMLLEKIPGKISETYNTECFNAYHRHWSGQIL